MKKILIVGLTLIGLAGVGWIVRSSALATNASNFSQPVVDKLVERFGLNKDEVNSVFDEVRQEWLDEAVGDGVITTEQKQALLNKQTEMQEKHQQLREEWQRWREQSGIDFEALAPYHFGGCGGRGFGKMRGFGGF